MGIESPWKINCVVKKAFLGLITIIFVFFMISLYIFFTFFIVLLDVCALLRYLRVKVIYKLGKRMK